MSNQKSQVTDAIIQEWDVSRRTAEFFDRQLGRLREIGIASSIAIAGLAVQFQPAIGALLLPLNFIFPLMDRRSQKYLVAATTYASSLETNYQFAGTGLTLSIRARIGGRESSFIRFFVSGIYVAFFLLGIGFLAIWLNLKIPSV